MKISGQLEIDHKRGVIYFHANPGQNVPPTVLRICRLGPLRPIGDECYDITHLVGHNMAKAIASPTNVVKSINGKFTIIHPQVNMSLDARYTGTNWDGIGSAGTPKMAREKKTKTAKPKAKSSPDNVKNLLAKYLA